MQNRLIDDFLKEQSNPPVEEELFRETINNLLTRLSEMYHCKSEYELSNEVEWALYIQGDLTFNLHTNPSFIHQLITPNDNHELHIHNEFLKKAPRIESIFSWIFKSIQSISNYRQRQIFICVTIAVICNNRLQNTPNSKIANSLGISAPDFSQRKNRFIKNLKQEIKRIQNNPP